MQKENQFSGGGPTIMSFEGFTEGRIERGLLANIVPRRLVETRTAVCNPSTRFGKATLSFIEHNYLRVGQIAVAGKMIASSPDGRVEFDVVIPQRHTLVSCEGPMSGNLDAAARVLCHCAKRRRE